MAETVYILEREKIEIVKFKIFIPKMIKIYYSNLKKITS